MPKFLGPFMVAVLIAIPALASPPGGKGGLAPSAPAAPHVVVEGISLGTLIGVLLIFGAVILTAVYLITGRRRK
jgi:hypothetical protein